MNRFHTTEYVRDFTGSIVGELKSIDSEMPYVIITKPYMDILEAYKRKQREGEFIGFIRKNVRFSNSAQSFRGGTGKTDR